MRRSRAVKCDRASEVCCDTVPAPVFQPTTVLGSWQLGNTAPVGATDIEDAARSELQIQSKNSTTTDNALIGYVKDTVMSSPKGNRRMTRSVLFFKVILYYLLILTCLSKHGKSRRRRSR
jgi:hypothetical protein